MGAAAKALMMTGTAQPASVPGGAIETHYGRDRDDYRDGDCRQGVSRAARYGYGGSDYGAGYGAGATSIWGMGAGRDDRGTGSLQRQLGFP